MCVIMRLDPHVGFMWDFVLYSSVHLHCPFWRGRGVACMTVSSSILYAICGPW